ncbi:MAG: beta-ribofuranosylaminobenzene 5'-phosphate synthase [Candidatus Syntropharchaeia archaeon]
MKAIIKSPSRLHFTLIDLNGELGRIDGGIGVALKNPHLEVEVSIAEEDKIPERAMSVVERMREKLTLKNRYRIEIVNPLPSHVGLGSQTQLSLSIAKGIALLEKKNFSVLELARIVRRGGTSGIGIAAFEKGGFILDGGHSSSVKDSFLPSAVSHAPPPPIIFQHPLPEDWYFVIAIPDVKRGAHGKEEIDIFQRYCPIQREEIEKLTRIILMKTLPSIVEEDITTFGESLTMIQGIGFKRIECELQDEIVRDLFDYFRDNSEGYGMSSFGPTVYAIVEGKKKAEKLSKDVKKFLVEKNMDGWTGYSETNNTGAEWKITN